MQNIENIFPLEIRNNFSAYWTEQENDPKFGDFPAGIPVDLVDALSQIGIQSLYKHQALSIKSTLRGDNVFISTGTASGKSLCYQIPILSSIMKDELATSILLFPTKALSSDQIKGINKLISNICMFDTIFENKFVTGIYDGDTNSQKRTTIRNSSNILITNPDMLHIGILPHHPSWERIFSHLKYIVIDEAHTYSGVFGSHFANVIRRLKRISAYYGSKPQFILSSATIANPREFAKDLIEENVIVIYKDFSPHGQRSFIFYNPPIIDPDLGIRKSMSEESLNISNILLKRHLQTIMFCRSRKSVERMVRKLLDRFGSNNFKIAAYRSGYRKDERRLIEDDLKSGKLDLVVSTIALELGIDMGMVDTIVMNGYPGSISRFLQQAGRAGRNNSSSLCLLIASSSPLDQFIIRNPNFIKGKSPENILINPDNPYILFNHIRCASFEMPFSVDDSFGDLQYSSFINFLSVLEEINVLYIDNGKFYWTSDKYPASEISLRSINGFSYQLFTKINGNKKYIGDVNPQSVKKDVHPGAIYLHGGKSYLVINLDNEKHQVEISADLNSFYYTQPIVHIDITIEKIELGEEFSSFSKGFGEVLIVEQVKGYKRILWETNNQISIEELDLEPDVLQTNGIWLKINDDVVDILKEKKLWTNSITQYGANWGKIRDKVLFRDNNTCQFCKCTPPINNLHIHHIQPFRSFNNPFLANKQENLVTLCSRCHKIAEQNLRVRSTLCGFGYAFENVIPIFIKCSVRDIGYSFGLDIGMRNKSPGIIIFDQFPGGIGLAKNIYQNLDAVLRAVKELISSCPCKEGCPSCVGPGGENGLGAKTGVNKLLNLIIK